MKKTPGLAHIFKKTIKLKDKTTKLLSNLG